jgi:hypothetical protein
MCPETMNMLFVSEWTEMHCDFYNYKIHKVQIGPTANVQNVKWDDYESPQMKNEVTNEGLQRDMHQYRNNRHVQWEMIWIVCLFSGETLQITFSLLTVHQDVVVPIVH